MRCEKSKEPPLNLCFKKKKKKGGGGEPSFSHPEEKKMNSKSTACIALGQI